MTPERRKYIASISNEEKAIRREIRSCKSFIKTEKDGLNLAIMYKFHNDVRTHKQSIYETKITLKALKKALPVKRKFYSSLKLISNCPICGDDVSHCEYCPSCGQKMR